jgi:hypothetical protein
VAPVDHPTPLEPTGRLQIAATCPVFAFEDIIAAHHNLESNQQFGEVTATV